MVPPIKANFFYHFVSEVGVDWNENDILKVFDISSCHCPQTYLLIKAILLFSSNVKWSFDK